jgi:predicted P-loop ATPase
MTKSQILEQKSAPNSPIVPENQVVSNSITLTQKETETSEAVKNTLVTKGHRLHIEDFEDSKRVETVNFRFLKLLNYSTQDTIFARVIGDFPENKSGKLGSILPDLKDCNKHKNQNVYFVVNGGGHKAKDVKVGRALMLEIDKDEQGELIPIDDQYQIMVNKFGIPTVAVFTGNKSLHCYYVYEEPIDPQLWQQMQEDALAYCPIADQSIKDLPRVLRLVGFKHSETGEYSRVYAESGIKYSYDELRSKIPVKTVETKKPVFKAQKARKAIKVAEPNTASETPCLPSNEDVNSIAVPTNIEDAQRIIEAGTDENGLLIVQNIENRKSIKFDTDDYVDILPLEFLVRLLEIKTALEVVDTKICDAYDTWLNIGMALHHEGTTNNNLDFSEAMRELFHAWSQGSDKYEEVATEAKWDSFSNRDDSVKINTLFYHAHQKTDNVERLARNIYPLVDKYHTELELNKQKQSLTTTLNADVSVAANKVVSFQDKKVNINTRMFAYIESVLRPTMRYNLHTGRFEIDGKEMKNVDFIGHLSTVLNYSVSQQLFALIHEKYSEELAYHPFEDYLRMLWVEETNPTAEDVKWANEVMQNLVINVMKVDQDEFAITLVKKWLVAMVSRVLQPGIKFDHVLTLIGGKGLGKTTFFTRITGAEYFTSHTGSLKDKDTLMKFHKRIIIELGEIEAVFRKTDIAVMKDFITSREDLFRLPYASQMTAYLRRFVLGASANSRDFLREPDGNRRFWIININHKIDTDALEAQREDILKAALILRANGEKIYLSDTEQEISNQRNMQYVDVPLLEEIEQILQSGEANRSYWTVNTDEPFLTLDVSEALSKRFSYIKISTANVSKALKVLGFEQKRIRNSQGRMKRYWVKEEEETNK